MKVNPEWVLPPTVYSVCEKGKTGKSGGSGNVPGTLLSLRAKTSILCPKNSVTVISTGEVHY